MAEKTMITITSKAREKIRDLSDREKNPSPIRIMPAGGCTACRLGMLFDSARAHDEAFDIDGIRYVIDRDLLRRLESITIDYMAPPGGSGFLVSSGREMDEPFQPA